MGTSAELIRALAVLAEPPAPEHAAIARALGLGTPPSGAAFTEIFAFQLYPYASVYLGPEGMLGGPARDRVAGFWRAVGQTPPAEPDHLCALLGLYAGLCAAEDAASGTAGVDGRSGAPGAGEVGPAAEAVLLRRARRTLLHEHVMSWAPLLLARVREVSGGFYGAWAAMLERVLDEELARVGRPDGLPAHLVEAPGLPDPRRTGGEAFVAGLLAPVRAGVVLTRADLAALARSLDLGLRLGERRYVVLHLLAQDARGVLDALARLAGAQAEAHEARATVLGPVAAWWADRARTTAALLESLAKDVDEGWTQEMDRASGAPRE